MIFGAANEPNSWLTIDIRCHPQISGVAHSLLHSVRLTPILRVFVCKIETPPGVLLDCQLARLSGMNFKRICYRRLTEKYTERIDARLAYVYGLLPIARPSLYLTTSRQWLMSWTRG
ncbi:MAG: hypothetical protein NT013_27395 [Planctomycetia bacterium]|nr:hypothetical protein [Planctomycetia bacterium]